MHTPPWSGSLAIGGTKGPETRPHRRMEALGWLSSWHGPPRLLGSLKRRAVQKTSGAHTNHLRDDGIPRIGGKHTTNGELAPKHCQKSNLGTWKLPPGVRFLFLSSQTGAKCFSLLTPPSQGSLYSLLSLSCGPLAGEQNTLQQSWRFVYGVHTAT